MTQKLIEIGQYQSSNAMTAPATITRNAEITADNWEQVHEDAMSGIGDPWCSSDYGFSNVQFFSNTYMFVHTPSKK